LTLSMKQLTEPFLVQRWEKKEETVLRHVRCGGEIELGFGESVQYCTKCGASFDLTDAPYELIRLPKGYAWITPSVMLVQSGLAEEAVIEERIPRVEEVGRLTKLAEARRKMICRYCSRTIQRGETYGVVEERETYERRWVGFNPKWGVAAWRYPTRVSSRTYVIKRAVCGGCIEQSRKLAEEGTREVKRS